MIDVSNEYDKILMNIRYMSHVEDNPNLLLKAVRIGRSNKHNITLLSVLIIV